MLISLCLIAKNEAKTIGRALQSVLPVVDEYIIGVDSSSTDDTFGEVRRFFKDKKVPHEIYLFKWEDDFSKARNDCIAKSHGNFIMQLDGHEYLESGVEKILQIKNDPQGYEVFLMNINMIAGNNETMFEQEKLFNREYQYHNKSHNVIVYDSAKAAKLKDVVIKHERDEKLMNERQEQRRTMNMDDLKSRIWNGDRRAKAQIIQEYMSQQNWAKSIDAIFDYLKEEMEDRERYQVYIKLAMCFFYSEKYDECYKALLECNWCNADKRNAHLVMGGMLCVKLKKYVDAKRILETAIKMKKPETFWFLYPKFYYEVPMRLLRKIEAINDYNELKGNRQTAYQSNG